MKEITITIPDNCELKKNGNSYTIVEKGKLTYEDVARELFLYNDACYINSIGEIKIGCCAPLNANNCTSLKQAEKLIAINKLMNVAKYLNGDWQPDWNSCSIKYFIYYSNQYGKLMIDTAISVQVNTVYFKSEKLAHQAIEILGEETIKLALCTDY